MRLRNALGANAYGSLRDGVFVTIEALDRYLQRFLDSRGISHEPLETAGGIHIQEYTISNVEFELAYFPDHEMLGLFAHLFEIGPSTPQSVYGHLLSLNHGDSGDGAFCLDEDRNLVKYLTVREFHDLDFEEFINLIDNFLTCVNQYQGDLKESYGGMA